MAKGNQEETEAEMELVTQAGADVLIQEVQDKGETDEKS